MSTVFCYFADKEFELPQECVDDCSQSGPVDEAVAYWQPLIALNYWTRGEIIKELQEYGAWTKEELEALSDAELEHKIIWLASCDAKEQQHNEERSI